MYETRCFPTNQFYPMTLSYSSSTCSPHSLKYQRLFLTPTCSSSYLFHQYFQQQYLFDRCHFLLNRSINSNSNSNNDINVSSTSSSSSSTTSAYDQLNPWLAVKSLELQQSSTLFETRGNFPLCLCLIFISWLI